MQTGGENLTDEAFPVMRMIRIENSGNRKTWLATKFSDLTDSLVIPLDHIFWEPVGFGRQRTPETMADMIDLKKEMED
jgi:hypothetical protein